MRAFANIKNPGARHGAAGAIALSVVWWTNAQFNEPAVKSQPIT